jgi:hypothetical protein
LVQISYTQIPDTLENLTYALEPLISGILLTNITQFAYHRTSARKGTHWQRRGPVYWLVAATILSMLMPMAVLFIYVGELGLPDTKMWHSGSWMPNTPHGIVLYIFKWLGTFALVVGVLQATNLHKKIRKKWNDIRGGGAAGSKVEEVTVKPCKPSAGKAGTEEQGKPATTAPDQKLDPVTGEPCST